jgi:hypothetical protein
MMASLILDRPSRNTLQEHNWVVAAILASLILGALSLVAFRGWLPHDEGTLGQVASRILSGQWPHTDFYDPYPGLQGYFHAGLFAVLGESIRTLRIAWLLVAAATGVAAFSLVRREMGRWLAAVGVFGATVLGFTLYPSSMPTWWNLMFGLVGIVFVVWGRDSANRLFVAIGGLFIGAGILIKPVSVYFAVPLFLWLAARDGRISRRVMIVACVASAALLTLVIAPVFSLGRVIFFWLPAVGGVAAIWLDRKRRLAAGIAGSREGQSRSPLAVVFGSAVVAPAAAAFLAYATVGRADDLIDGWIRSPGLRFDSASMAGDIPLVWGHGLLVLGLGLVFALASNLGAMSTVVPVLGGGLFLWSLADWEQVGNVVIETSLWMPLLLVGVLIPAVRRGTATAATLLVGVTAAMFAMVQVPLWNGYYAAYTIPLFLFGFLMICQRHRRHFAVALSILALALIGQSVQGRLLGPLASAEPILYTQLDVPRGGIEIPRADAYYVELSRRIENLADGRPVYSGPDAPEIAFLAGANSATPAFFEVLALDWDNSKVARLAPTLGVVAINHQPYFSEPIRGDDLDQIYAALPESEDYGFFELRWRSDD